MPETYGSISESTAAKATSMPEMMKSKGVALNRIRKPLLLVLHMARYKLQVLVFHNQIHKREMVLVLHMSSHILLDIVAALDSGY
jgi:hypothetical protein